ncbi:peptidase C1B, bleomycin hydrolase [Gongronella butleri]|nr:peptidase C1B, bleomycin hydrolase [Gongronella butleri]
MTQQHANGIQAQENLQKQQEQALADALARVDVSAQGDASVSLSALDKYSASFWSNKKNVLAMHALTAKDPWDVLVNPANTANRHVFNVTVDNQGDCLDQKRTGRCWLFAGTTILRRELIKKFNLKPDFELSQTFLFFYDKFEKANSLLENMIDLWQEDIDDRVVQYLLTNPLEDGGTFAMYVSVVNKYGLVPKSVYGETEATTSSLRMNWLLTRKLREFTMQIRKALEQGIPVNTVRLMKQDMLDEIYRIMVIFLGEPPKTFDWQIHDKDGKYIEFNNMTPLQFKDQVVGCKIEDNISLLNDTRHEMKKVYTVDRLRNVVGGLPVRYLNVDIEKMKQLTIAALKNNRPVWFGVDMAQFKHRKHGILDTTFVDYELGFDIKFNMTKKDRVLAKESLMTHAMVFTGVHLDEQGNPIRWRVQNSHSKNCGENGYWSMSDEWFSEHLYQVVLDKSDVDDDLVKILETETPIVLKPWDPMGALA